MIKVLEDYFKTWSTHMDFVGQKRAERIFQILIVLFGVVGFCIGYTTQQLSHAVYTLGVGFALSCFVILPPWPFLFRLHPLNWQKPIPKPDEAQKKKKK